MYSDEIRDLGASIAELYPAATPDAREKLMLIKQRLIAIADHVAELERAPVTLT